MGDGNEMLNTVPATYNYGEINIYTVCLTVWNDNGCTSKFCDYVYSGSGDICEFAACVYPGDTNADGGANVYDLLPIGVGYGMEGPPRQLDDVDIALDWSAQYAPEWGVETINGQDFKHLDCNGDGEVTSDDAMAISANYAAPSGMFMVQAPGSPLFWLDFEWDTILIDDNTPSLIELEADLMVGSPSLPIENLSGFALQLKYPEDMVAEGGVLVDYHDNSFFGSSNNIIWLNKNRQSDGGEFDLGFTQKSNGVGGFGKMATLSFIVISDLVARGAEAQFTITLSDVVAVNPEGAMLTIGNLEPATVHVVDKTTDATSTKDRWLNNQVHVFPNPASDYISVHFDNLQAESLAVFNQLGQQVAEMASTSNGFEINAGDWEQGIYLLKVKTDKGVAIKRVLVH